MPTINWYVCIAIVNLMTLFYGSLVSGTVIVFFTFSLDYPKYYNYNNSSILSPNSIPLCRVYLCVANTNNTQSATAAVKQICEADSSVLILAFAFVPRGLSREKIKTKSSPSVLFLSVPKWQRTTSCIYHSSKQNHKF